MMQTRHCAANRFPDAVNEAERIEQNAIRRDLRARFRLQSKLGHEFPFVFASLVNERSAIFQQCLKGSSHGALVFHAKLLELCERFVISSDALVIRLKRKSPHAPFVHEIRKSDNFRRLRVFVLRNRLNYDG